MLKIFAMGSAAVALALFSGTAAMAAPVQSSVQTQCPQGGTEYEATNDSSAFTQASGSNSSVSGGPNVKLSISTSTTYTVTGTLGATTTITASAVIGSVSQAFNVSIAESKSGTTSVGGAWTVPADYQIGRLAIGSLKHSGTVTRYTVNPNCSLTYHSSTSYNAPPSNEWTFTHTRVS